MNARRDLYAALMAGGPHSPDRSEKASELIDAFRVEVRGEAADDVHRADLPTFAATETPELVAKVVRAVDVRLAVNGPEAPYGVAKPDAVDISRAAGFMRGYVWSAGPVTPSDLSLLRAALFAHLTPDGAGTEPDFPQFAALLDEYVNACTEQLRLQLAQEAVR